MEQHHLYFEMLGIRSAKASFDSQGKRVRGAPRTLIFLVNARDMGGVLAEIMQTSREAGH